MWIHKEKEREKKWRKCSDMPVYKCTTIDSLLKPSFFKDSGKDNQDIQKSLCEWMLRNRLFTWSQRIILSFTS